MREPPPYLALDELPRYVPFSTSAIRALISRGELVEGEHFFRRGRRLVFRWSSIVEWLEGPKMPHPGALDRPADVVPLASRG